jgi:hypothetical protein
MFLANVVFFTGYRAGDKRIMFLPTYVVWAVWMGLGYDWLLDQINTLIRGAAGARLWRVGATMLFPGLAMAALLVNYQHADLSDDWRTYERASRVLDTVEPGAYVLATSWWEVAPLEYLRVVEQRRLDVSVINRNAISISELYSLIHAEGDSHPFYSTRSVGVLAARYEIEYIEDCECYRIR